MKNCNEQRSPVENGLSICGNIVIYGRLIVAVSFLVLFTGGCSPGSRNTSSDAVDSSLKLDLTFEEEESLFQFDFPSSFVLDEGEGFIGMGSLTLWFTEAKLDSESILMRVHWLLDEDFSKSKSEIALDVKKKGGTLNFYEKTRLDGRDCIHLQVAYGGMLDPRGSRISEQYLMNLKNGNGFTINFSAPAAKFDEYRPKFNTILKTFKFDVKPETTEKSAKSE